MKQFSITNVISCMLLLVVLASCEKNIDTSETIIVEGDPMLVATTVVKGTIKDVEGNIIPGADVFVYHQLLTHHVIANSDGNYAIEFPTDSERIQLNATATNYHSSPINIEFLHEEELVQNFTLASATDLPYELDNSVMVTDSLYEVSGTVLNPDGSPQVGSFVILFDLDGLIALTYDVTDEEGNYSYAYEEVENKYVVLLGYCSPGELIDSVSIVDQDIDLGVYESTYYESQIVTISGVVTDCNTDELLPFGDVTVSIPGAMVVGEIVDGLFSVEINDCNEADCYDIAISSPGVSDGEIIETCQPLTNLEGTGQYELCGDPIGVDGEITLEYDGATVVFEVQAYDVDAASFDITLLAYNDDLDESLSFTFSLVLPNGAPIDFFEYSQQSEIILSHNDSTGMNTVFDINSSTIEGTFEGPTYNASNETVFVSGSYSITE